MSHHRPVRLVLGALIALCLAGFTRIPTLRAQTPGTTPIPANSDWDQETQNAVNAINTWRAAQLQPLQPLPVDATLQNAAAWTANNQFVTRNCLGMADQGVISCGNLDTLARTAAERLSAFGYQGGAIELYGYAGRDGTGDITTGQGIVDAWRASTTRTTSNLSMLDPGSMAIGIARQCQTFGYGFACIWWAYFGTNLNQPFAPAAQAAAPATGPFNGVWNVDNFGGGTGGMARLVQTGNQIIGTYSYADPSGCGNETGTITGTVNGNVLTFRTIEAGCGAGGGLSGTLTIADDGRSLAGGTFWNATLTGP